MLLIQNVISNISIHRFDFLIIFVFVMILFPHLNCRTLVLLIPATLHRLIIHFLLELQHEILFLFIYFANYDVKFIPQLLLVFSFGLLIMCSLLQLVLMLVDIVILITGQEIMVDQFYLAHFVILILSFNKQLFSLFKCLG